MRTRQGGQSSARRGAHECAPCLLGRKLHLALAASLVALAAVWVVIFLLHLTAPDEPRLAGNSPGMTMRSFAMLHEQTLMMAESLGQPNPRQPAAADPGSAETTERNSAQTTHRLT